MSNGCKRNKIALVCGAFLAFIHAIWALVIAVMPETFQKFLDWVFEVHFLKPLYVLEPFSFGKAVQLVVLTFVSGYVLAWVFGLLWHCSRKCFAPESKDAAKCCL